MNKHLVSAVAFSGALRLAIAGVTILGGATAAHAASGNTSTAAGTATATIIAPIVLIHTPGAALNFGKFTVGTGGTVVVSSSGTGSVTSDVGFVPGSVTTADQFSLTGDIARAFGITTTSGTISNGTKSMAFTTTPSSASGTTSVTGTYAFSVGGTLTAVGTETAGPIPVPTMQRWCTSKRPMTQTMPHPKRRHACAGRAGRFGSGRGNPGALYGISTVASVTITNAPAQMTVSQFTNDGLLAWAC